MNLISFLLLVFVNYLLNFFGDILTGLRLWPASKFQNRHFSLVHPNIHHTPWANDVRHYTNDNSQEPHTHTQKRKCLLTKIACTCKSFIQCCAMEILVSLFFFAYSQCSAHKYTKSNAFSLSLSHSHTHNLSFPLSLYQTQKPNSA